MSLVLKLDDKLEMQSKIREASVEIRRVNSLLVRLFLRLLCCGISNCYERWIEPRSNLSTWSFDQVHRGHDTRRHVTRPLKH
jgi:hypothetical protein